MENKESDSSSIGSTDIEELLDDGKNKYLITCVRCPSKILSPTTAEYKEIEFSLPVMTLRKERANDSIELETLSHYWMVKDKFIFENIGFSNTVSGFKYLICADCEIGPIGWFDPASQLCYVSVARVKHQS